MAKYVCDFDIISSNIKKMEEIKENVEEYKKSYANDIESSLSTWNGEAKQKFVEANLANINKWDTLVLDCNTVIEFLKESVSKIESTEESLSKLCI